jgi:hypothetical protein
MVNYRTRASRAGSEIGVEMAKAERAVKEVEQEKKNIARS